jgi:hypothetical protein
MSTVTCRTDGCMNAGIPLEMNLEMDLGDGQIIYAVPVWCGPCGQEITDIDPPPPTPEEK